MTDIQRHLKGIRKILRGVLQKVEPRESIDINLVQAQLRAFLPQGYGIGTGVVKGAQGTSQPLQIFLYDAPLARQLTRLASEPQDLPVESLLLVVEIAKEHSETSIHAAIARIASVKSLRTPQKRAGPRKVGVVEGQTRRTISTDRLPYALLSLDRWSPPSDTTEVLVNTVHTILRQHAVDLWPDEIEVHGEGLQFLNPLLEQQVAPDSGMGWSCLPDHPKAERCYVCKARFWRRHFFYEQLCVACGDYCYQKRWHSADLRGYYILVTGARVKIGYATTLRLLRMGATVIATSRFPHDTTRRYAQEPDFAEWRDRLHVHAFDLRQIPRLTEFLQQLDATYPYLDAVINNAAQTVKRPDAYYAHLLATEPRLPFDSQTTTQLLSDEPFPLLALAEKVPAYVPTLFDDQFPHGEKDEYGEQQDNRDFNSWVMPLEQVSAVEMVEVHVVNAVAPALIAGQLKPMLLRSPHRARFIINVAAAEGRFSQYKNGFHPHTNMAKAALNMLTRTIADAYSRQRIYVTSVDPGWVSDQAPRATKDARTEGKEKVPMDMIDAAARLCYPIIEGIAADIPIYGKLLKDYKVVAW